MSAAAPNSETLSLDEDWYTVAPPDGSPDPDLTNDSPESSGEITASWHFSNTTNRHFTPENQVSLVVTLRVHADKEVITGTFELAFERLSPNKPVFKQDYTAKLSMTRDAAGEIHYEVLPGLSDADNATMLACLPFIKSINDHKINCYLDNIHPVFSRIIAAIKSIIPADQSGPLSSEQLSQLHAVIVTSLSSFEHLEYVQEVLRYLRGIQTNQMVLADRLWIIEILKIILFKGLGIGVGPENDSDLDSEASSEASSDASSDAGNNIDVNRILSILLEHADKCAASDRLIRPSIGYNPLFDERMIAAGATTGNHRYTPEASALDTIANLKNACCLS